MEKKTRGGVVGSWNEKTRGRRGDLFTNPELWSCVVWNVTIRCDRHLGSGFVTQRWASKSLSLRRTVQHQRFKTFSFYRTEDQIEAWLNILFCHSRSQIFSDSCVQHPEAIFQRTNLITKEEKILSFEEVYFTGHLSPISTEKMLFEIKEEKERKISNSRIKFFRKTHSKKHAVQHDCLKHICKFLPSFPCYEFINMSPRGTSGKPKNLSVIIIISPLNTKQTEWQLTSRIVRDLLRTTPTKPIPYFSFVLIICRCKDRVLTEDFSV